MNNPKNVSELKLVFLGLTPYFGKAFFFSAVAAVLSLAPTVYMLQVFERVTNSQSLTTLAMLTLLVLWIYVVMEVFEWARSQVMYKAGIAFDKKLRTRVFDAVLKMNLRSANGSQSQALSDLKTVREALPSPPVLAAMEAPISLLFLAIVFWIHPLLGWFALVGVLFQLGLAWLTERKTQPHMADASKAANGAQNYVNGALRNTQVMASMGMVSGIYDRWMGMQRQFLASQARASDHAGGLTTYSKSLQLILTSGLLGLGCWLMLQGELGGSGGLMIVGSVLGGKVVQPLVQVVSQWKLIANARQAYGRLDEMLRHVPASSEQMSLPAPIGQLQVEALTAVAPGGQSPILSGIQFGVPAGGCLAVIGPSASGKTTLARLLMGVWPAAAGKVRLDGVDVFGWNKEELGPHVGYLAQGLELFDGTLGENIARFGPPDRVLIERAIALAGLGSLTEQLPKGLDTPIGEAGAYLSGGQRQRVGLARAVYGNPKFVVLDEPNASLDEQGDLDLLRALQTLKENGTTLVVITHRTGILAVADLILVLRDGAMHAFGPRDAVLQELRKRQTVAPAQQNAVNGSTPTMQLGGAS